MDLKERANDARQTFMRDRIEHRLDEAMLDNHKLRDENDRLRGEIHRDEEDRKQMWSTIEKSSKRKPARMRSMLMLLIAGGAAYIAGTKAGRERYDQLRGWFDQMRGRAVDVQGGLQTGGDRISKAVRSTVEDVSDAASA